MATEIESLPEYHHTMEQLESAKRLNPNGFDYWMAREINDILGYPAFDKFLPVIERAAQSLAAQGVDSSHHIAQTSKLMEVHGGGKRRGVEFFLSRAACYLIAMNGDPSKPEIAGAQAYFAAQTRRAELMEEEVRDRTRLVKRRRVSKALKDFAEVAQDKGVQRFGLLNNARYQGLYDRNLADVLRHKGLEPGEQLLDWAEAFELSAHEFQSHLAKEALLKDERSGEQRAIEVNRDVAADVRKIMAKAGRLPEDLPLAKERIQSVEKRLKAQKKLPAPGG